MINKKNLFIIVISIVLLVSGALAILLYFKKNSDEAMRPNDKIEGNSKNTTQNDTTQGNPFRDRSKEINPGGDGGINIEGSVAALNINKRLKKYIESKVRYIDINPGIQKEGGSKNGIHHLCNSTIVKIAAVSSESVIIDKCPENTFFAGTNLGYIEAGTQSIVIAVYPKEKAPKNLSKKNIMDIFNCKENEYYIMHGAEKSGTTNYFEKEIEFNKQGSSRCKEDNSYRTKKDEYTKRLDQLDDFYEKYNKNIIFYGPQWVLMNPAYSNIDFSILTINEKEVNHPDYPYKSKIYYLYRKNDKGDPEDHLVETFLHYAYIYFKP